MFRFDSYEVDLSVGHLRERGVRIRLRDQPFQVLAAPPEHPGRVVTREELRRRLWHTEVFVDFDNGLNIAVARLRTVLGDSAKHPRFIETLPKRGYRFIGKVSSPPPTSDAGPERKPRLLVLPFVNASGDPEQEYFSDAMTDEIITAPCGRAFRWAAFRAWTAGSGTGAGRTYGRSQDRAGAPPRNSGGALRAADELCLAPTWGSVKSTRPSSDWSEPLTVTTSGPIRSRPIRSWIRSDQTPGTSPFCAG